MPELTGSFDTSKLPRIAPGTVTVTIARTVKPGLSAPFVAWSDEMLAAVKSFPGCLGATMLHPGSESDEYHIVFRFVDAVHLRQWERSAERSAVLAKADELITAERVTVTAGADEFFRRKPKWRHTARNLAASSRKLRGCIHSLWASRSCWGQR